MTVATIFVSGLLLLILGLAVYIVTARESFAAVVAFVVYGLLLSLAWMALASPDVALTEAAVGGGVTGALLLSACARLRGRESPAQGEVPSALLCGAALVLCAGVAAGLAAVVLLLPDPAPTLAPEVGARIGATGLGNPVTAVLLAFRALDTLLEKVVLLLALLGVWSLAADPAWGGRPAFGGSARQTGPLVFLTRVAAPVGLLAGIYLFWVGADLPGGTFQGGAILAAMWILGFLAGLALVPRVGSFRLRLVLTGGTVIFVAAGLAGFWVASGFLAWPAGYAKPVIVAIEAALTLSIAVTLGLLVAGPPEKSSQS